MAAQSKSRLSGDHDLPMSAISRACGLAVSAQAVAARPLQPHGTDLGLQSAHLRRSHSAVEACLSSTRRTSARFSFGCAPVDAQVNTGGAVWQATQP